MSAVVVEDNVVDDTVDSSDASEVDVHSSSIVETVDPSVDGDNVVDSSLVEDKVDKVVLDSSYEVVVFVASTVDCTEEN